MVRIAEAGGVSAAARPAAAAARPRPAALALRWCRSGCGDEIDDQPRRGVRRLHGGSESAEPRAGIDRDAWCVGDADVAHERSGGLQGLRRQQRRRGVEGVGVELDEDSFPFLRDGAVRARRRVDRQPAAGAERIVSDENPRHAQVADDQQARRLSQIEPRVVDECQGAADEFHRDEPPAAASRRRGRQRHQPSRDRGQRLLRRQHNGLAFVRHRDGAERFFADRELKGGGEVVEGDELLVRHHRDRQCATAFARQHRQRRAGRRLAGQRRDESGEDDEWKRGREKWQRTSVQMEIPHLIVLGTGLATPKLARCLLEGGACAPKLARCCRAKAGRRSQAPPSGRVS